MVDTLETAAAAAGPVVRIEPGRGRDWATHVAIAEWEGPLGLLLSLIEARRFDVLTVPLGGVAEAYLEALAAIEHDRMGSISSFVAVASQLILIKSRAMLPRPPADAAVELEDEGADPEAELRARLLLYRAFRDAGAALRRRARSGRPVPARAGRGARRGPGRCRDGAVDAAHRSGAPRARPRRAGPGPARRRAAARGRPALDHARPARLDHPARAPGRADVVLQDLLRGVRDRVVSR